MGLFDSPTHLLIILAVLVLLFGSAKLPKAARSMGEAMRIFKKESAKLHDEDSSKAEVQASAPQQVAPPQQTSQDQMLALQEQMDALQKQMAAQQPTATQPAPATPPSATAPETQRTSQP